jgi:hypothetical protein
MKGPATSDGASITVTGANRTSIACAVPAGLDGASFLAGQVKAGCDLVNGVPTVNSPFRTNRGRGNTNSGRDSGDDQGGGRDRGGGDIGGGGGYD